MRNINLRYVNEAYDAEGLLTAFDIVAPDDFNFAYDVVDDIAANEPERTAMVWCNPEGEEHVFTFADMKTWSDKTASFLAGLGIGQGDYVMVILRRHYQFWFTALALAKLGAVMVPAASTGQTSRPSSARAPATSRMWWTPWRASARAWRRSSW